jgi:hypothetical protein
LAELFEGVGEGGVVAVGVADDEAALVDEGFELGFLFGGEGEDLVAGDEEDGGIVEVLGRTFQVDDLPGELALELAAHPADEIGAVARALVPVGGLGGVAVGVEVVLELVHDDGGAAADEEEDAEAGIDDALAAGAAPGTVLGLVGEEVIDAVFVPIDVAEIFVAAGEADAFHAVESVDGPHTAKGLLVVGDDPAHAGVDGFVGKVAAAIEPGVAVELVEGDEEGGDTGGGHGGGGDFVVAQGEGRIAPATVFQLGALPGGVEFLPDRSRDFCAGLAGGPEAQHAELTVAVVEAQVGGFVAEHSAEALVGLAIGQEKVAVALRLVEILTFLGGGHLVPDQGAAGERVGAGDVGPGEPVNGLGDGGIFRAVAGGEQRVGRQRGQSAPLAGVGVVHGVHEAAGVGLGLWGALGAVPVAVFLVRVEVLLRGLDGVFDLLRAIAIGGADGAGNDARAQAGAGAGRGGLDGGRYDGAGEAVVGVAGAEHEGVIVEGGAEFVGAVAGLEGSDQRAGLFGGGEGEAFVAVIGAHDDGAGVSGSGGVGGGDEGEVVVVEGACEIGLGLARETAHQQTDQAGNQSGGGRTGAHHDAVPSHAVYNRRAIRPTSSEGLQ